MIFRCPHCEQRLSMEPRVCRGPVECNNCKVTFDCKVVLGQIVPLPDTLRYVGRHRHRKVGEVESVREYRACPTNPLTGEI